MARPWRTDSTGEALWRLTANGRLAIVSSEGAIPLWTPHSQHPPVPSAAGGPVLFSGSVPTPRHWRARRQWHAALPQTWYLWHPPQADPCSSPDRSPPQDTGGHAASGTPPFLRLGTCATGPPRAGPPVFFSYSRLLKHSALRNTPEACQPVAWGRRLDDPRIADRTSLAPRRGASPSPAAAPAGVVKLFPFLSGGIARRLAQPLATVWNASGVHGTTVLPGAHREPVRRRCGAAVLPSGSRPLTIARVPCPQVGAGQQTVRRINDKRSI
jgi:hypothetical protein